MWFFRAIWFCLVLGVAFSNGANAASPSDTTIPPASEIIDSAGNVWTLVNSYPLENGNSTAASGFSELLFYNGNIYGYARSGNWSQWYGFASGGWANVSGNPSGGGPTSPTSSIPPASQLIDSDGNVWTLVNSDPLENGKSTAASGFSELLVYNGNIYGYASSGNWSQWYLFASGAGPTSRQSANGTDGTDGTVHGTSRSSDTGVLVWDPDARRDDWPTVSFGVLGKGSGVTWPFLETSRGAYNWSTLDGYVAAAQAHGIPMIYSFEGVPGWAIAASSTATCGTLYNGALSCPTPPDNIADWTNFVTALVTRYCPAGVPGIQYYELWNEPYDVYGTQRYSCRRRTWRP